MYEAYRQKKIAARLEQMQNLYNKYLNKHVIIKSINGKKFAGELTDIMVDSIRLDGMTILISEIDIIRIDENI